MDIEDNSDTQVNSVSSLLELKELAAATSSSVYKYAPISQTKQNMLTINTRYVSNVSIGFRLRPTAPHVRFKPYQTPQKERHRTKSENNDVDAAGTSSVANQVVEQSISESITEVAQLKKAKSLESILAEANDHRDLKNIHFGSHSELEQVSDAVQKLRVVE